MQLEDLPNHFVILENKDGTFSIIFSVLTNFNSKKSAEDFIESIVHEYNYETNKDVYDQTGGTIH